MTSSTPSVAPQPGPPDATETAFSKITWRLIPLLFICYLVANIDRVNLSIAQLQMKTDLGFSDAIYGLGAGIFFLSYFLFEVPSNLLLERLGARRILALLMIGWGLTSSLTMFVRVPMELYVLRFLLGVFEAGFFPGVVFYLTRWYPLVRRVRALGLFSSALALANVVGGLVSGWIMKGMGDVAGLRGWQWLFPLEGLPCILLGFVLLVWLRESADHVHWLNEDEKRAHAAAMQADAIHAHAHHNFAQALANPRLYSFAFVYFAMIAGIAILTFWIPTIIHGLGIKDIAAISMLSALPSAVSATSMIVVAAHAQRMHEFRWHLATATFIAAIALAALPACTGSFAASMALLCIAAGAVFSTVPVFWGMASAVFTGTGAAGSIALISSLGLIAAFISSPVTGWLKTTTGTFTASLYAHAAMVALGGMVALLATRSAPSAGRS
ncbi:MAG: MFS transporter [Burkholderiaceae bacterium]|nr:MFS transporter [Burkholderiaceae bacterium]